MPIETFYKVYFRAFVYFPWGRVSYTFSSFKCASPSRMYCVVSITTTQEPLSACLMVMEWSFCRPFRAIHCFWSDCVLFVIVPFRQCGHGLFVVVVLYHCRLGWYRSEFLSGWLCICCFRVM